MTEKDSGSSVVKWIMVAVAIVFGLLTLKSGGTVLFGSEADRLAAGNYVPFVLWFNFTAGFAYLVAGVAIALNKPWVQAFALAIAVTTLVVFSILGAHIIAGGAYETKTVAAMTVRSTVWLVISAVLYRQWKRVYRGQV